MPQFLFSSLRKCTALYNQLSRFAVCHQRQPAMRFTGHTALLRRLIMRGAAVRRSGRQAGRQAVRQEPAAPHVPLLVVTMIK